MSDDTEIVDLDVETRAADIGPVPSIETLTRRLVQCPPAFLSQPVVGDSGLVAVNAVFADALASVGMNPGGRLRVSPPSSISDEWHEALAPDTTTPEGQRWLGAALVTAWLVTEPTLCHHLSRPAVLTVLQRDLVELVVTINPEELVTNPDRREELVRLVLRAGDLVAEGETAAQAADRLATLDTAGRQRVVLEASREAEDRAQAVREALAKKAAEDAAARAGRE